MYEVTIAIPVYHVEAFIKDSLYSALDQTFRSIEFLIIDDCGKDKSMEIIREIASTHPRGKDIRIISHAQNQGIAVVRNTAIENSSTKYLYFLDSDDCITPNCIELLYKYAEEYQTDFATASYENIGLDGHRSKFGYPSQYITGKDRLATLYFTHYKREYIFASIWNKLYRTEFLQKNNIVCIPHIIHEEPPFIFQLIIHTNSCYTLPDITYIYKLREGSATQKGPRLIPIEEIRNHIKSVTIKKTIANQLKDKPYFPELALYIMHNCINDASIYVSAKKEEPFTDRDLKNILTLPFNRKEITHFSHKKFRVMITYSFFILPACIQRFFLLAYIKPKRYWWKLKRKLH